ncbi:GerAB/ArcD/ProY family transporter [Paenibacillus sp. HW567]|uniref:GerAB/ArcD/ProY family transporter n=1 Tax=Paenibacillus sp. HW567 TaxID=1034769 RepID=UPI0003700146|nr:endospore germination permease [Paenibacillus sp. HW567]
MKNQESISALQLAVLFLSGMTGSSIILIPSPLINAAKNGAWLSFSIAWVMGFLLLCCMLYLHKQYPGMTFVEYSNQALGKWLTCLLMIPFACALFWQNTAIVIEISGFFNSTIMTNTPVTVINTLFFVSAAVTARAGIEVMARMFFILLIMMYGFVILVVVLASGNYHPEFLQPVMADGFRPILHGAYIIYGFPFTEVVLYASVLPFVRKDEERVLGKYMFIALVINGVILMISVLCTILALGPLAGEMSYSLYQLARLIYVQEIIERVEPIIGFSLIAGSYMKTSIMIFILTNVLSQVFKVKDYRVVTFPVTLLCLLLSITMYHDQASFNEDGYMVWTLFDNLAYVLPMILIAAVTLLKNRSSSTG